FVQIVEDKILFVAKEKVPFYETELKSIRHSVPLEEVMVQKASLKIEGQEVEIEISETEGDKRVQVIIRNGGETEITIFTPGELLKGNNIQINGQEYLFRLSYENGNWSLVFTNKEKLDSFIHNLIIENTTVEIEDIINKTKNAGLNIKIDDLMYNIIYQKDISGDSQIVIFNQAEFLLFPFNSLQNAVPVMLNDKPYSIKYNQEDGKLIITPFGKPSIITYLNDEQSGASTSGVPFVPVPMPLKIVPKVETNSKAASPAAKVYQISGLWLFGKYRVPEGIIKAARIITDFSIRGPPKKTSYFEPATSLPIYTIPKQNRKPNHNLTNLQPLLIPGILTVAGISLVLGAAIVVYEGLAGAQTSMGLTPLVKALITTKGGALCVRTMQNWSLFTLSLTHLTALSLALPALMAAERPLTFLSTAMSSSSAVIPGLNLIPQPQIASVDSPALPMAASPLTGLKGYYSHKNVVAFSPLSSSPLEFISSERQKIYNELVKNGKVNPAKFEKVFKEQLKAILRDYIEKEGYDLARIEIEKLAWEATLRKLKIADVSSSPVDKPLPVSQRQKVIIAAEELKKQLLELKNKLNIAGIKDNELTEHLRNIENIRYTIVQKTHHKFIKNAYKLGTIAREELEEIAAKLSELSLRIEAVGERFQSLEERRKELTDVKNIADIDAIEEVLSNIEKRLASTTSSPATESPIYQKMLKRILKKALFEFEKKAFIAPLQSLHLKRFFTFRGWWEEFASLQRGLNFEGGRQPLNTSGGLTPVGTALLIMFVMGAFAGALNLRGLTPLAAPITIIVIGLGSAATIRPSTVPLKLLIRQLTEPSVAGISVAAEVTVVATSSPITITISRDFEQIEDKTLRFLKRFLISEQGLKFLDKSLWKIHNLRLKEEEIEKIIIGKLGEGGCKNACLLQVTYEDGTKTEPIVIKPTWGKMCGEFEITKKFVEEREMAAKKLAKYNLHPKVGINLFLKEENRWVFTEGYAGRDSLEVLRAKTMAAQKQGFIKESKETI
ncbi:MAG: hypothetical protein NC916_03045, partial [Candidatus Omnitrophica bacterium]|nr:hypothetical protein [Candidatus Omnitrophota bacterium]